MEAVFLKIYGHVQGVGFRYFTYRIAHRLGVKGYVRNAEDGTVEIHAEGDKSSLEQFVKEVSRGPSSAIITKVECNPTTYQGFEDFTITR
ncbi:acylphosphatase [Pseudothermotoga thermarum]|uniref:Acylphosphatase n=1 Tax=Pseudothermotoga thermarum DSM 5069 TaxID=688269 RepID=F7YYB2_9THEM|nr:acylphosphatase [Pseudothermotoga thermarum]AEH50933.1 acylphosphatase [Pseudothermotoga thermarum DSM 5069]